MAIVIVDSVVLTGTPTLVGPIVPAGYNRKYLHAVAYNSTGLVQNVNLFLVSASAALPVVGNQICHPPLESGDTYLCSELVGAQIGPGGALWADCLNVNFSYVAEDTAITGV